MAWRGVTLLLLCGCASVQLGRAEPVPSLGRSSPRRKDCATGLRMALIGATALAIGAPLTKTGLDRMSGRPDLRAGLVVGAGGLFDLYGLGFAGFGLSKAAFDCPAEP